MTRRFKNFIFLTLILFLCTMQLSSYALTNNVLNSTIPEKGSKNNMSISDSRIKSNGEYYFKIDNLNLTIYELEEELSTPINELTLTDGALKNSTFKDMVFTKDKLILVYEILNQKLIPYHININSSEKNKSKDTFIKSSTPDKTPKKLFESRGNLIFFYDISDIEDIKLDKKLYIHGDYETSVQKDNMLYLLTAFDPNAHTYFLDNNTSEITDIINIDNAKSDRIHNLNKVDLIKQNSEKISSIKCDSIIEYLTNDSLYFINLDNTKSSTIHRLSFTSDKLSYVNKFSVDGYLTNPEFINEYNKKLTFIYQSAENHKNYNLVLLDQNLNLLNEIKNINNSRNIKEVKFIKSTVNILIDSTHIKVVDFSSPSEPKIYESDDNIF